MESSETDRAVDRSESLDAAATIKHSGSVPPMRSPAAALPRRHSQRMTREQELFKAADAFDSLVQSASSAAPSQPSPWRCFVVSPGFKDSVSVGDAKIALFDRLKSGNAQLQITMTNVQAARNDLAKVSQEIAEHRFLGTDVLRDHLRFQIALHNFHLDFYENVVALLRDHMTFTAEFLAFLGQFGPDVDVDINGFLRSRPMTPMTPMTPRSLHQFAQREAKLKKQVERMLRVPRMVPDPKIAFFVGQTPAGQIVSRLLQQVQDIRYHNLCGIANALLQKCPNKGLFSIGELMDRLFDLGWTVTEFPYCDPFTHFRLPPTGAIVPKVFNPSFIAESWQLVPFELLAGRDWPLRPAVDQLFVIMILTNPFAIADQFYTMIEEIGRCVRRIFIRNEQETSFVEIDFDQIFVLMILCVLACGIPDILRPMKYASSFARFLKADPQKQYGMSHMEGLCAHLAYLDYAELTRQSHDLLNTRHPVDDPLAMRK
jgi:hypothetical protein